MQKKKFLSILTILIQKFLFKKSALICVICGSTFSLSAQIDQQNLVATQGQAKYLAYELFSEMEQRLAVIGGAGDRLTAVMRQDWFTDSTNNDQPITITQLQAIAIPFYDRLNHPEVGLDTTSLFPEPSIYPWTSDPSPNTQDSPATIGQLYFIFDLDLEEIAGGASFFNDLDKDGVDDVWEIQNFGILYRNLALDFDGDGLSDSDEYIRETEVDKSDTDGDGILDGDDTDPIDYFNGNPPTITLLQGASQEGAVGAYLKESYLIEVTNSSGQPLANAPIRVRITQGDGFFEKNDPAALNPFGPILYTDQNGQMEILYRYGSSAFTANQLIIKGRFQNDASGITVDIPLGDFDFDGILDIDELPENPLDFYDGILPSLEVISQTSLNFGVYSSLPSQPFVIRVLNAQGSPMQNAPIFVSLAEGDGAFRDANSPSANWSSEELKLTADNDGLVKIEYRYGSFDFLQNTIKISARTLDEETNIQVVAIRMDDDGDGLMNNVDPLKDDFYNARPPTLTLISGNPSFGVPQFFSDPAMQVLVTNSLGEPLAGAPLFIEVISGDGTLFSAANFAPILNLPATPSFVVDSLRADQNGIVTVQLLYGSTTFPENIVQFMPSDFLQRAITATVELATDTDGDGIPDYVETRDGTDPGIADENANGIPDGWERLWGLDSDDPLADTDGDGVSDLEEYQLNLNPTSPDTDGDRLPDAWEVHFNLDPRDDGSVDPINGANGDPDSDSEPNLSDADPRSQNFQKPTISIEYIQ